MRVVWTSNLAPPCKKRFFDSASGKNGNGAVPDSRIVNVWEKQIKCDFSKNAPQRHRLD